MALGASLGAGAETISRFAPGRQRVVKVTRPGELGFGATPFVNDDGDIVFRKGTPVEYLDRLSLANQLFGEGPQTRFEGVVQNPNGSINIVTSQPYVLAQGDRRHPAQSEIDAFMARMSFSPVPGMNARTFYYREMAIPGLAGPAGLGNVAVFDAKPDNFIRTPRGLVPIDVTPIEPDEVLQAALRHHLRNS